MESRKQGASSIKIFIDDGTEPIAEGGVPNQLEIDTTSVADGKHKLKIVATDADGVSNEKTISFTVRNGPFIAVNGLKDGETVDRKISLILDAYDETSLKDWRPSVIEEPTGVPFWYWGVAIAVLAIAIFYAIALWGPNKDYFGNGTLKNQVIVNEVSDSL